MTSSSGSPESVRVVAPPLRTPARADWAGRVEILRGRRVAVATETEVREDAIAWSDLIERDGALWVEVVQERAWWEFMILGAVPTSAQIVRWPAGAVWIIGPEVDLRDAPA